MDQAAADALAAAIKARAESKKGPGILEGVGSFAAAVAVPGDIEDPVVVSACDGVGTKTMLLRQEGKLETAGMDLVASCVNDMACLGATPWTFLDYYGCGKLDPTEAEAVLAGIEKACAKAGCELVGGETAQLPGLLPEGGIELVGFATGIVARKDMLGPGRVRPGDAIVGILAVGLHCNGFSLVRKVLSESGASLSDSLGETTLSEALLAATPLYAPAVLEIASQGVALRSVAHITGGGLVANLSRALPNDAVAQIDHGAWQMGPAHGWLARTGGIDDDEMMVATNGGIGMALVVAKGDVDATVRALANMGHEAVPLGEVAAAGKSSGAETA